MPTLAPELRSAEKQTHQYDTFFLNLIDFCFQSLLSTDNCEEDKSLI